MENRWEVEEKEGREGIYKSEIQMKEKEGERRQKKKVNPENCSVNSNTT
jgi:hypothetical protein